jgi:rod shape-determining protein MreC
MAKRVSFFSPFREFFALIVAIVVSAILIQTNDVPQMIRVRAQVESVVKVILSPFRFVPHAVKLWEENEILRRQTIALSQENAMLKEALLENVRLRKLLGFKERELRSVIAAEIIGRGAPFLPNRLLLNMGSNNGVKRRSAVVTADGLVGKIIDVGSTSSVAGILMDRNMGVAARLQDSRVDGIVHWDGGHALRLEHIPITTKVEPGERVVTSGIGGVYPEGLLVGIVRSVRDAPDKLYKIIVVSPAVDFSHLEEVFILEPVQWELDALRHSE